MTTPRDTTEVDVAVVGGGIVGLAHALATARTGRRVALFERSPVAQGASIRNFGMVWPVGQRAGAVHQRALRSREVWCDVAERAGLWYSPLGSLHVAYEPDVLDVLDEFVSLGDRRGYDGLQLLSAAEVAQRSPAVRQDGLLGALFSPTEVCVDPREAIARLPAWLAETYGVALHYGTAVVDVEMPLVRSADGRTWRAEQVYVCSGVDFETLFPEAFTDSGLVRCKLQMMRTAPQPAGLRIGPLIAGGLTLRHYGSFTICPSLPAYVERISRERPELDAFGIHVMASQNGRGEVIIGDSHEYGDTVAPFDNPQIDRLILGYLASFLDVPDLTVAARWHGVYAKVPDAAAYVSSPAQGVRVVTGLGGAGMSTAFGLAEEVVAGVDAAGR